MHSHDLFSIWHWQFDFSSEITICSVLIFFYLLKVDVLTKYFIMELQKNIYLVLPLCSGGLVMFKIYFSCCSFE